MMHQRHRRPPPERRATQQGDAIRQVFTPDGGPLTIAQVLARAQHQVPSLNVATVYRNLNRLVADGWLVQVAHPEVGPLYERAQKAHHHHFYCRRCATMFELPGCPLVGAALAPTGFIVHSHDLFLNGICNACSGLVADK